MYELTRLGNIWTLDPQVNDKLRDMRRHFHTFKGNGRAVGANVLGELGWAAQDMLDRVLDGELVPSNNVQAAIDEVISALPDLVASYKNAGQLDLSTARELTNRCFRIADSGESDLAEDLPNTDEEVRKSVAVLSQPVIPQPIGH